MGNPHDPYRQRTIAAPPSDSPALTAGERRALLLDLLSQGLTLAQLLDQGGGRLAFVPLCTPNINGRGCQQHGRKCEKPGKTPLVAWKCYQLGPPATAAVLQGWRRQYPTANWGLVAGPASGILLLDQDGDTVAPLPVPATLRIQTGRPGGFHHYVAQPDGVTIKNTVGIVPGWDVRSQGGLIVLPGSLHPSGVRYRVDGASLRHGIAPIPPALLAILQAPATTADGAPRPRIDMGTALGAGIGEGERDATLWRIACKLRHADIPEPIAERLVLEAAAACTPPFPAATAREKVTRAYDTYELCSDDDSATVLRLRAQLDQAQAENGELRQRCAALESEVRELRRQEPAKEVARLTTAAVRMEENPTTRGFLAPTLLLLGARLDAPDAAEVDWCTKQRTKAVGWGTNVAKMRGWVRRGEAKGLWRVRQRDRGKRPGEYDIEQHLELSDELPRDPADFLAYCQRRLSEPVEPRQAPTRKVRVPCGCNADACPNDARHAIIKTVSGRCETCGIETTKAHDHAAALPIQRNVLPVQWRRPAGLVLRPSGVEKLHHTPSTSKGEENLHHSAPSGSRLAVAVAVFERLAAQAPAGCSPEAAVAWKRAALEAATALPLAAGGSE